MSISYFVADLPPHMARRICVIREEMTQTFSSGFYGGGTSSVAAPPLAEKKQTRCLIRASDLAMIFRLPNVEEVLAILYEDQKHVRTVRCGSECDGPVDERRRSPVVVGKNEVFVDDRGFLRVVARLVQRYWTEESPDRQNDHKDGEAAMEDAETGAEAVRTGTRAGEAATSEATNGKKKLLKPLKNNKTICRKPFVRLNEDASRIVDVYATKQDLVKRGGFKTYARALASLEDESSSFLPWKDCPFELKTDFFRRGGQLALSKPKKTSKAVEQLDSPGGRVVRTYSSMTDATIGAGSKTTNALFKLKHAIQTGKPWQGSYWRLAAPPSTSSEPDLEDSEPEST